MKHFSFRLLFGTLLGIFLLLPFPASAASEPVIRDGVYAQGLSLGGMTRREATRAIDDYFQGIADSSFTIVCMDGRSEQIPVSDWEFTWDTESTVDLALRVGNEGSLLARYKSCMDLKYGNLCLDVPFSLSGEAITGTLEGETIAAHDEPAANAAMSRHGSTFTIDTVEAEGTVTDAEATRDAILDTFAGQLSGHMSVTVLTRIDEPTVTTEDLEQIQDLLGTFSTTYGSSASGRKTNIQVATDYLNGTVVRPGESLSVSEAIRERTEENGYAMGSQYSNGESEEAVGGGVCQVSTTLYNALLRAEIQIDKRSSHSMVVSYVDYGTDASISEGSKDLVFTNDTDYPIYLEGEADGDTLRFSVYGVETRPANREVKFEAETTEEEWPTERKVRYSSEIESGDYEVTGTVRPAVTATLTKVVYVDGEEVERTLLHTDYYSASQQTITYGTG